MHASVYDCLRRLVGRLCEAVLEWWLECSPYYGKRRPPSQRGARLLCVSDLLLLGRTTIEEARSLLYWLEIAEGYKKLGICGLSMGM